MRAQILAVALLLLAAGSLDASEPLSIAVSPAQSFAPTNLTIRVHIDLDADNRTLEVVADSGAYYRSSQIQIDGADAPRTISIEIRNVPGGNYEVRGVLINSAGKQRASARTHAIVIDSVDAK
jgi:hypothetical protein